MRPEALGYRRPPNHSSSQRPSCQARLRDGAPPPAEPSVLLRESVGPPRPLPRSTEGERVPCLRADPAESLCPPSQGKGMTERERKDAHSPGLQESRYILETPVTGLKSLNPMLEFGR